MVEALREALRSPVRIVGTGSHRFLPGSVGPTFDMTPHSGIIDLSLEDRMVTVTSGTTLKDFAAELEAHGVALGCSERFGTVGGWIASGRPHLGADIRGGWKDWVTGMTVMLASGEICRCGAKVVKSVAGYDLHRFLCGSRGQLAVILDVTMRLRRFADVSEAPEGLQEVNWIHGMLPSEVEETLASYEGIPHWQSEGGTLIFAIAPEGFRPRRSDSDWVMNPSILPMGQRWEKARGVFDPQGVLM